MSSSLDINRRLKRELVGSMLVAASKAIAIWQERVDRINREREREPARGCARLEAAERMGMSLREFEPVAVDELLRLTIAWDRLEQQVQVLNTAEIEELRERGQ